MLTFHDWFVRGGNLHIVPDTIFFSFFLYEGLLGLWTVANQHWITLDIPVRSVLYNKWQFCEGYSSYQWLHFKLEVNR